MQKGVGPLGYAFDLLAVTRWAAQAQLRIQLHDGARKLRFDFCMRPHHSMQR